jgi:hypothetical protein
MVGCLVQLVLLGVVLLKVELGLKSEAKFVLLIAQRSIR